jgi:hypothetical protein
VTDRDAPALAAALRLVLRLRARWLALATAWTVVDAALDAASRRLLDEIHARARADVPPATRADRTRN